DNTDLKLKPGMTANATFIYAERDEVLRVPNAALRLRPSERAADRPAGAGPRGPKQRDGLDRRTVWIARAGKAVPVPVRVGITDGSFSEIVEGALTAGDPVITEETGGAPEPKAQA